MYTALPLMRMLVLSFQSVYTSCCCLPVLASSIHDSFPKVMDGGILTLFPSSKKKVFNVWSEGMVFATGFSVDTLYRTKKMLFYSQFSKRCFVF